MNESEMLRYPAAINALKQMEAAIDKYEMYFKVLQETINSFAELKKKSSELQKYEEATKFRDAQKEFEKKLMIVIDKFRNIHL